MLTDYLKQLQASLGGMQPPMNDPNDIENIKAQLLADAERRGLNTNAMDSNPQAPMTPQPPMPTGMLSQVPQQQPSTPPSQGGTGFMDFVQSPQGKGLLYGAGMGLLAKMNDRTNPIVPTAMAGAEQFKKQDALTQLGQQIASANLTPAQKAFVQAAFTSGDPKMMETAAKFLATQSTKPVSVGAGSALVDPTTGKVIYQSTNANRTTNAIVNADALGLKPGTQAYNDYIREQTVGRSMGVFQKNELAFAQQVAQDNNLEGGKLQEAIDVLKSGGTQLQDGTPLTFSQTAREKLDAINKARTTGQLITQGVQANQADAEMKVFDPYIKRGNQHYGDTIAGFSPKLERDSLIADKDTSAADRLSDYYTGQILNFDKAQLQIRIAMANPSVSTTEDLMKISNNMVKQFTPIKSAKVRNLTIDKLGKALQDGLDVRNKYGIGASGAFNPKLSPNPGRSDLNNQPSSTQPINWKIVNGQMVQG